MAERFQIDIVASPRQAQAGIRSVEGSLESLNRTAASTNSLLRGALQVAGIGSGIILVQRLTSELIDLSDAFVQIQNRLSVVTKGTEDLARVTEDLFGVSQRSRTSFEATAQLYARTALATRDLGTSSAELLGITESVNQAIILSGASAKEASNGLIQLSQAIASNRLGGDELRSVLEQLPVVADVIARELGVTRGELRALGTQGKITADVIINAFRNAQVQLEQKFAKTVPTIGQAFQILENSAIRFIGRFNQITGASATVARSIQFVAANLENLAFVAAAAVAALSVAPLVRFVQGLKEAVVVQRAFAAEVAAGIAGTEAAAVAAQNAASATFLEAGAKLENINATIASIEAQRASTLVAFEATEAGQAQAVANLVAARSNLRRAEAAIVAADAEAALALQSANFSGSLVAQAVANQAVQDAEAARFVTLQAVKSAEVQLTAAVEAGNVAAAQRVAIDAQLAGLEARRVAATEALTVAQSNLNKASAAAVAPIGRITAFLRANPFGVAVVGSLALVAALADVGEILSTIGAGFAVAADFVSSLVTGLREAAQALPTVGKGLQTIVQSALIAGGFVAAGALALTAPFIAAAAAITAAALALGQLKRGLDKAHEASDALGESLAIAPIGQNILAARENIEGLTERIEELSAQTQTPAILAEIEDLGRLADKSRQHLKDLELQARKLQGTFKADTAAESALRQRLDSIREEINLLGKSRRERELETEVLREQRQLEKQTKRKVGPDEVEQIRALLRTKQAAEDLADVLDDIRGPDEEFRRQFDLLTKAEDEGKISAEELSGALNRLFAEKRAANPLQAALTDLRQQLEDVRAPTIAFTGDAGIDLDRLRAANREREVQIELEQRIRELRDAGVPSQFLVLSRSIIENLIRERTETERIQQLNEQVLQSRRDLADATALALIPDDFERQVAAAVQAQRDLADATIHLTEAEIRQNLAAQEAGEILQGLQDPILARAQAQAELAAQIARVNELLAQGGPNAASYAIALQDLEFRAAKVGTTFKDGLVVAFREFQAATTEAAIAQTALTSAINAAADASAEFVRTGTVDFRQLALSVLADISRIITKLLLLRAIEAATNAFGGNDLGNTAPVVEGVSNELAGFAAGGGPIQGNRPFLVGEEGPELFVPGNRGGTVVPTDQTVEAMARAGGGSAAPVVVPAPSVNVTVVNQTDPEDSVHSDAGERRILNVIERNPNRISRLR